MSDIESFFLNNRHNYFDLEGYSRYKKNIFSKKINDDFYFTVRICLYGKFSISSTQYFGIYIPSIENKINKMKFFSDNRINKNNIYQTFFQKSEYIYNTFGFDPKKLRYEFQDRSVDYFDTSTVIFEKNINDINACANYCIADNNLPLGHHCFRVPFILIYSKKYQECASYMKYVQSQNLVSGYEKFANELYYLMTE